MTTPFIEITRGGPAQDIEDGVYTVVLTDIQGPKVVTATRGANVGQEVALLDWILAVDDGEAEGTEIVATSSTASGPKSKMYSFLTAFFGGKAPPVGTKLEKDQILGRRALATIAHNEGGWPIVANLGAIPNSAPRQAPATPTDNTAVVQPRNRRQPQAHVTGEVQGPYGAPRVATGAPAPVATADDDLPF